jgi:sarcosine oxidase
MHIVVVGAGAFGTWTAHHLQLAGARVTLADGYGPASARASSGDESRIIRCGYGPDAIYSTWARRSLGKWQQVFERIGQGAAPLFHRCGVLWLSGGEDSYTQATRATLETLGYPIASLDGATLRGRFPQFEVADVAAALFEEDCGVLMARRAVQALARDLESRGVRMVQRRAVVPRAETRLTHVRTDDGGTIEGDGFVFACGPWLPKVFPELLGSRIRPTRQVVIYFGAPAGDDRFGPARTPAWVDFPAGIYGVPDLEHRGVKVGLDRHGPPFDPDSGERVVDAASIEAARAWLRRRLPALADTPVLESRVCQYENTDTGDFLIDRHPSLENAWIAGGGSGHGFKHAPAVGAHVASLVLGTGRGEPRFALASRGSAPKRSVY